MNFSERYPTIESFVSLDMEELGYQLLPTLVGEGDRAWHIAHVYDLAGVGEGSYALASPVPTEREAGKRAIAEAWAWLVGQALLVPDSVDHGSHMRLSRRAQRLATEIEAGGALIARRLPRDLLVEKIRDDVWSLYQRGKYDSAVFEAMKAVEIAVREAAGLEASSIGVALMREAFNPKVGPKAGPLADMTMVEGEREARSSLFAGAIGAYKNPHSHRNVPLDQPDEALEIIMLANHLLRIVESRRLARLNARTDQTSASNP